MVTVMLEPVGATTTWDETPGEAIFPIVTGQFQRVSFALDGIVCAIDMGYVMTTSIPTVVRVDALIPLHVGVYVPTSRCAQVGQRVCNCEERS